MQNQYARRSGARRYGRRSATALATLSLAGVLAVTGCSASGDQAMDKGADAAAPRQEDAAGKAGAAAPAAPAPSAADKNQPQAPAVRAQIIRTATLSVETADAQKATAGARTAAEGAGGYVGGETTKRGADGAVTSTVTLRVPGDRFDAVLGALEGSGKLLDRKVEAQDVTQKVTDVDSRVKTQQASVARVRDMMEKATALGDVVTLEAELSKRQSDLESLMAQQTALKDQTSLGTITLTFSEPGAKPAPKKPEAEPGFLDALSGGWSAFATLVQILLMALAAASPFLITGGALLLGFRRYRKWRPAKPKTGPVAKRVPAQVGAPGTPPGNPPGNVRD